MLGLNRRGLRRTLLLATAVATVLLGAACCANDPSSLQRSYEQAYGDGSDRNASLLGSTLGLVTDTTTTLLDTTTNVVDDTTMVMAAPLNVSVKDGFFTQIKLDAKAELSEARLILAKGDVLVSGLSGTSTVFNQRLSDKLNCIEVIMKDGGKWYFDPAGKWYPDGYKPIVGVTVGRGMLQVSSTDAVDHVLFFYADGSKSNSSLDSRGRAYFDAGRRVSYSSVALKFDQSKWYFDGLGTGLPTCYKPTVSFAFKNNSVSLSSSDVYSEVLVRFTDGSAQSWSTNEYSGWYKPFQGRTLDRVEITLKSNGSKWYFDSYGVLMPCDSKWYTDID